MKNMDLRQEISAANLKLWQVADALGVTDSTFSRKLRKEFPDSEKQQIREIIHNLSGEDTQNGKL